MAANFYLSSHANYHLHPRSAILAARSDDCKHATEQELAWIEIWSGSVIQLLCKRLGLHQQVISTAVVYFRRFYLRNSYCETDPALVAAACCYVAAKAEETPVHVKSAMGEAKAVLNEMGYTTFSTDNTKLAEMEFYLIEELDFHLIVFHPYRSLLQLCGRERGESGKAQRDSMLELEDQTMQMAWWIINDSFRTSFSVLHPPHLIALAAIYLALCVYPPSNPPLVSTGPAAHTRLSSIDATTTTTTNYFPPNTTLSSNTSANPPVFAVNKPSPSSTTTTKPTSTSTNSNRPSNTSGGKTDPVTFLASLEVDHSLIMEIVQEFVSVYELWNKLEVLSASGFASSKMGINGSTGTTAGGSSGSGTATALGTSKVKMGTDEMIVGILARMRNDRSRELEQSKKGGNWR